MEITTTLQKSVHDDDIPDITLHGKSQTLDSLVEQLEEELGLQYRFPFSMRIPILTMLSSTSLT